MRQVPTLCHHELFVRQPKIRSKKGFEHVFESPDFFGFYRTCFWILDFRILIMIFIFFTDMEKFLKGYLSGDICWVYIKK
jgi:hypothetical protein